MPHSVFTGRVVEPGEPLFLLTDTDAAVALAEEEQDTCPSCGFPKVWCQDAANQFAFEAYASQCHVTYARAAHRNKVTDEGDPAAREAMQVRARFRAGKEPDIYAGLGLEADGQEGAREDA